MYQTINFDPYKALKSILEVTSAHIGKDFIKVTAQEIKKLFQADLVFITKALDFNPTTHVEVLYATDETYPKHFDLDGTPCKLVFKNETIKINENLKHDFEKEKDTDFESFYGVPINDESNVCIGHIAILSNKKRDLPKELEDIALIYSRKIERETKRLELEQENEKIRNELEKLTITDTLTNLYNRRYFDKVSKDIFAQVKREYVTATLAYIDLDNFKNINDRFGHEGGDEVLEEFALIMKKNSRECIDNIFRIGGEEFCIISTNSSLEYAYNHLQRIMKETKTHFSNTKYGEITLSIGLVQFDKNFDDYNDVIKLADKRMYEAKNAGKNMIYNKD